MQGFYLFRKGETWWARKRRKGQPDLYLNTQTNHKGTAQKRASEWVERLIAENFGEKPRRSFEDAAVKMAKEHLPTLKLKSRIRYTTVLDHLLEEFEGRKLDEITSSLLSEYEVKRRNAGVKPTTIGLEFRILGILFRMAKRWEWTDRNPALDYLDARPKADIKIRKKRTRFLSHEEETQVLKTAPASWRWRIIAAIETGLRLEEQFSLLKGDLDLRSKRVRVRPEVAKNAKPRWVPLTERALAAINGAWIETSEYVFPRDDGQRFAWNSSYVNTRFKTIANDAKVDDVRWHDLRRTCGCRLLQDRRFSIEAVSKWLGHSSISITQDAYAFLYVDHLQQMLAESEGRISSSQRVTAGVIDQCVYLGNNSGNGELG